ncbi:MAG: four helix bundle protein [Bacteroidota bacterium]
MHNFKNLRVWQEAMDLAVFIYKITEQLPKEERFGLTSQIRRSAVSVPSNIAEGAGRNTNGEFNHFIGISNGSGCELQTQIILANRLGFISEQEQVAAFNKMEGVKKMSFKLQQSLKKK